MTDQLIGLLLHIEVTHRSNTFGRIPDCLESKILLEQKDVL